MTEEAFSKNLVCLFQGSANPGEECFAAREEIFQAGRPDEGS